MDIATIVGFVAGIGVICGAILMSGGFGMFVDIPSVVVVLGGTFAATLMKFPRSHVIGSIKGAKRLLSQSSECQSDTWIRAAFSVAGKVEPLHAQVCHLAAQRVSLLRLEFCCNGRLCP